LIAGLCYFNCPPDPITGSGTESSPYTVTATGEQFYRGDFVKKTQGVTCNSGGVVDICFETNYYEVCEVN